MEVMLNMLEDFLGELNDLPDEILLIIFKKLNNITLLLCSLIGVNDRLKKIVRDPIFTRHFKSMSNSSNDSIKPVSDVILNHLVGVSASPTHPLIRYTVTLDKSNILDF
jgi:hypothetical protein